MSKQEAIEHLIEQLLEGDGFTVNWLVYTFETDILPDLHDGSKHRCHYHAVMAKIAKGNTADFQACANSLWNYMHESAKAIAESVVDDWLEEQKADNELQKAGV